MTAYWCFVALMAGWLINDAIRDWLDRRATDADFDQHADTACGMRRWGR